jgi:hypothetical protein
MALNGNTERFCEACLNQLLVHLWSVEMGVVWQDPGNLVYIWVTKMYESCAQKPNKWYSPKMDECPLDPCRVFVSAMYEGAIKFEFYPVFFFFSLQSFL